MAHSPRNKTQREVLAHPEKKVGQARTTEKEGKLILVTAWHAYERGDLFIALGDSKVAVLIPNTTRDRTLTTLGMVRKKTGQAPGRKSDFTGEKAKWLDSFCNALQEAGDNPGSVYTDTTKAFLLRYGYDLPFGQNVDGNPDDHPPVISESPDLEEKERRAVVYKQLRTVSFSFFFASLCVI
jgi:hypothetical protein